MFAKNVLFALLIVFALTITNSDAQISEQNEPLQNAERLVAAIRLGDNDPATFYNAACFYALAGKPNEAFQYLDQAVARLRECRADAKRR